MADYIDTLVKRILPAYDEVPDRPEASTFESAVKRNLDLLTGKNPSRYRAVVLDEIQDIVSYYLSVYGPSDSASTATIDEISGTYHLLPKDGDPPPPPTNLVVQQTMWSNTLTWDNPSGVDDLSHIEVWVSNTQSRSEARLLAIVTAPVDTYEHVGTDPYLDYYYWIRAVDYEGLYSTWEPPDAQGGYYVPPIIDTTIEEIVSNLTAKIAYSHLNEELSSDLDGMKSEIQLLDNQWTVKIDDNGYVAGMGLLVYPEFDSSTSYSIGDIVRHNDTNYRAVSSNPAPSVAPPDPTYWVELPFGEKSQVIVRTDSFAIVQPGGAPGQEVVPFVVGNIDGAPGVGIDGNLVVDGSIRSKSIVAVDWLIVGGDGRPEDGATNDSAWRHPYDITKIDGGKIYTGSIIADSIASRTITADKIASGTITANELASRTITADKIASRTITANELSTNTLITTSAQVANAVITNAKIADAAVTTLKVAGNAITIPVGSYIASELGNYQGTAVSVQVSFDYTTKVLIIASCAYTSVASAKSIRFELRVGTTVLQSVALETDATYKQFCTSYIVSSVSPGTYTYSLYFRNATDATDVRVKNRSISVISLKR